MSARGAVLDSANVENGAIEVHLVPAQVADLGGPQSVPEGDQDHRRVAMAAPVDLGGLDHNLDLAEREVLAGAKLGVRSTYPQCASAIDSCGLDAPSTLPRRCLPQQLFVKSQLVHIT
jgi:hypothetical protein